MSVHRVGLLLAPLNSTRHPRYSLLHNHRLLKLILTFYDFDIFICELMTA